MYITVVDILLNILFVLAPNVSIHVLYNIIAKFYFLSRYTAKSSTSELGKVKVMFFKTLLHKKKKKC